MKLFNVGILRPAISAGRVNAANDLVSRTLAQHGLAMPGRLAHQRPSSEPSAQPLPTGATFKADRFACSAGKRDYLTYVPASASEGVAGMIMMLHGCTQTHEDFARGTGMNDLAEAHRLIIVYPQQSRGDNAQSCWNWFSPADQRNGRGEPEILAQLAVHVVAAHSVPRDRIFVAGLSAGAAMAVILGQTHPDVFAKVGSHSGLPFGAARDVPTAFAAMRGSAATEGGKRRQMQPTRTIVFHGDEDATVHPSNSDQICVDALAAGPTQTIQEKRSGLADGRSFTCEITSTTEGRIVLEQWVIEGLGHAWSGGRPSGTYTDPAGPDASAEMVRFFLE